MPGSAHRLAVVVAITKLPAYTIQARRIGAQPWKIFVVNPPIPAAETEQIKAQCLARLKRAGIAKGAPDPEAAVDYYLQLRWKEYERWLGVLEELRFRKLERSSWKQLWTILRKFKSSPFLNEAEQVFVSEVEQLQHQKYRKWERCFMVSRIELPATVWARSIDGGRFEISVSTRRIPTYEAKQIEKDCWKVLKDFGVAFGARGRKTAGEVGLNLVWEDWTRRQKCVPEWDLEEAPCFQTWGEDNFIGDVRWALMQYCEKHPLTSRKTRSPGSQPGRPSGIKPDGAKIRDIREGKLGFTQLELANACDPAVSDQQIRYAEHGQSVSESFLKNLAKTFSRLNYPTEACDLLKKTTSRKKRS